VGGMRQGEVPRSGHLARIDFTAKWEELHRESMLRELEQRIRDVRQGPDGFLYVLTAENEGALMRIEPAPAPAQPNGR
jgi:aldose sugar dehydrogenase